MTCAICREKYYYQTEMEPSEPCACGESTEELETWRDRVKRARWVLAMACFAIGDRLMKWGKR